MSEGRFLADQAAEAKAGMVRSLGDIGKTLMSLADVRGCATTHPWIATGTALTAGAVLGTLLSPNRRKTRRRDQSGPAAAEPHRPAMDPSPTHASRALLLSVGGAVLAAVMPPLLQIWLAPSAASPRRPADEAAPARGPAVEAPATESD